MSIPPKLLQKAHYNYIDAKYKEGVFSFRSIDDETVEVIIKSFLSWAEEEGVVSEEGFLDLNKTKDW